MKKDIIKSLVMKSTRKYNSTEEVERMACLNKAEQLAIKYNLMDFFNELYIEYVKNEEKSKNKLLSFDEFISLFYVNGKGNLVLKLKDKKYPGLMAYKFITIVKCKNGSFLVRGNYICKFFLQEMIAFNWIYENIDHEEIEKESDF